MKRKRARRFCSPNEDGIYFHKDGNYIIIKIQNACFPGLLIGLERKSLIKVLEDVNSLRPIKRAFSDYGLSLKKCLQDNPEATLRVMRKRCQEEIERTKNNGYTTKNNIKDWKDVLRGAGKNPPEELKTLLENTIQELESVEIRENRSRRKRKSKRR
jgi:hypothetical protein